MSTRIETEHTFEAVVNYESLVLDSDWSTTMVAIGPVATADSKPEFCFWRIECIGDPIPDWEDLKKWNVTGCISKVAFKTTADNVTYESRMSSWKEALISIETIFSSCFDNYSKESIEPKVSNEPVLTVDQSNQLIAISIKLVYRRSGVLDASVPFALDDNIDVNTISEAFSGFQLNLRTSKNKAAEKELPEVREAAVVAVSSVVGPTAMRRPVKPAAKESQEEVFVYGLISIRGDDQNKTVSLYSLDKDLMKYLIGRFSCEKIKEVKYVRKSKALQFCKVHKIEDPFKCGN